MSQHLDIRQDDVQCPDINGKTISTAGQTFEVRCDWVLINGNCSTFTTIEDCIRTCTESQGCVAITINSAWVNGCCIPPSLDGAANYGWITAWNTEKADPPVELLSGTGTFTIGAASSTMSSTTTSSASTTDSPLTSSSSLSSFASPATTSISSPSTAATSSAEPGLSTAAKAGIGVGAGVGGLALLACVLYLAFRFGRRRSAATQDGRTLPPSPPRQWQAFPPMYPFVADTMPMQEADGGATLSEVDGGGQRRFELGETT